MSEHDKPPVEKLLSSLQERAKELSCLYEVEQALNRLDLPLEQVFRLVVEAIPPGWQYPDICRANIEFGEEVFSSSDPCSSPWVLQADIAVQDQVVGKVNVCYLEERPREAIGPFLKEEERLIRTIAERLGHYVFYRRLQAMHREWENASQELMARKHHRWRAAIELLRRTDPDLYLRTARKMLNHLCWIGIEGAQELLQQTWGQVVPEELGTTLPNYPLRMRSLDSSPLLSGRPFELAASALGDDEILSLVQAWIAEDKASFLPKVLHNVHSSLGEIAECLRRFHHLVADGADLPESTLHGLRVGLIRRFLTDQLELIRIAKQYIDPHDFVELLDHVVLSAAMHGKLGGKSAGLFVAEKILRKRSSAERPIGEFKIPRSWYVASEWIMRFIEHNDLEEVLQQKYRDISQVRVEYPNIVQLFASSRFPPEIVKEISMVLDEAGERPLIVRSSSLLEDRLGSAFAGKYKSLFLANQGSKPERLTALLDAIIEVYASVFGPDPITYRRERGLLDFHEEMAILIQEVVGTRVGDYYLPALAGVGFSRNEVRWAADIQREDGLLRLVPGLGTRAVDRVAEDYAILVVPGKPNLRVNTTIDEKIHYSPKKVDVINLQTSSFETLDIDTLLRQHGCDYPALGKVFSVLRDGIPSRLVPLLVDTTSEQLIVDFEGLLATPFASHLHNMLRILEESFGCPVDIEFAHDGKDLYLLQCRSQSVAEDPPAAIPRDVPVADILFTASRHVCNGRVPEITHVVYVDPERYGSLPERSQMLAVGKAVGQLNKLLPKRQFILIGPGRWGSRGDTRAGVSVTYADISSTAMLIEVARQQGYCQPEPSFGTHFFQDLVESSIRYLPLYPEEEGCVLNERFLLSAPNLLPQLLPEMAWLADTVRVVDLPAVSKGKVLRVLLNSELEEALGMLANPGEIAPEQLTPSVAAGHARHTSVFWQWRMRMAERIATETDRERFGVAALYVFGSTKNATAGPGSDIDLLVHFRGSEQQQADLLSWLDGWSLCLGEINYLRTGYHTPKLLDIHIVTDADIDRQTSFAAKIGAVTDAARPLHLGRRDGDDA